MPFGTGFCFISSLGYGIKNSQKFLFFPHQGIVIIERLCYNELGLERVLLF